MVDRIELYNRCLTLHIICRISCLMWGWKGPYKRSSLLKTASIIVWIMSSAQKVLHIVFSSCNESILYVMIESFRLTFRPIEQKLKNDSLEFQLYEWVFLGFLFHHCLKIYLHPKVVMKEALTLTWNSFYYHYNFQGAYFLVLTVM